MPYFIIKSCHVFQHNDGPLCTLQYKSGSFVVLGIQAWIRGVRTRHAHGRTNKSVCCCAVCTAEALLWFLTFPTEFPHLLERNCRVPRINHGKAVTYTGSCHIDCVATRIGRTNQQTDPLPTKHLFWLFPTKHWDGCEGKARLWGVFHLKIIDAYAAHTW
jgi:hypothetical protein